MGRLVHADLLAARALVQLRLIPCERARLLLRELDREGEGPDLLEGLARDGSLPREHVSKLRQRVALYERVWLEDFYLRQLQRRCRPADPVVADLIAALEAEGYERRVGEELVAARKLKPDLDRDLLHTAMADMGQACQRALSEARANDWAVVEEPLIAGSALAPQDYCLARLFRSRETQALVEERRLKRLRAEAPAPGPAPPPATKRTRSLGGSAEDQERLATLIRRGRVGPYAIVDALGIGGMGAVFLCQRPGESPYYALKVLSEGANEEHRRRFQREIEITSRIRHESVISILDSGEDEGLAYLVVPALWGEELRETLVRTEGLGLRPGLALHVFEQLLSALAACHEQGVVHRDVKPENVFVLAGGRFDVKLLDFGVAKQIGGAPDSINLAASGETEVVGTPAYLSPDVITNQTLSPSSDLYSLGVVFHELLTGELPIESRTSMGFLAQHLVAPPKRLSQSDPDREWPERLEELLLSLLAKKSAKRPQSCAEVLALLEGGLRREVERMDVSAAATLPPDYAEQIEHNPGYRGLLGRLS
ncbi:MAG TPA: hypothetical protein DEA08_05075 [Planctomycetes bacterium]|nr:hypothetical protein [Planctomycetota bacterium]